jgi:GNAT superfamily N-acetyltransferase
VTTSAVRIRPYESRDADAVSQLIRSTMLISNSSDYPLDRLQPLIDYFTPEKLDQINRDRSCFVAEVDSTIVGTAGLEGDALVTFFVSPTRQRQGIGAGLLREVEGTARSQGLRKLQVHSSLAGASFYEAMGYERTGTITPGTAGPHIEMIKLIV